MFKVKIYSIEDCGYCLALESELQYIIDANFKDVFSLEVSYELPENVNSAPLMEIGNDPSFRTFGLKERDELVKILVSYTELLSGTNLKTNFEFLQGLDNDLEMELANEKLAQAFGAMHEAIVRIVEVSLKKNRSGCGRK